MLAFTLSFKLKKRCPNSVFAQQMPVMDGSEATVRIREAEGGYGVRTAIVALSAHSKGEEVEKMVEAGVDGYITKPLNNHNLLKALSPLITKL